MLSALRQSVYFFPMADMCWYCNQGRGGGSIHDEMFAELVASNLSDVFDIFSDSIHKDSVIRSIQNKTAPIIRLKYN